MNLQNIKTEDFNSQQPLAFSHVLENSSSCSSTNGEETDQSCPVDAINISKIPQDLIDIIGNQDSLIRNEMPNVPMEDKVDGSLCLQASLPGSSRDLTYTEEAEPWKNALSVTDLSSWGSPEVVRKDSTLEPLPSLPLTPCLDATSQRSPEPSLRERRSTSPLQAGQSGPLSAPGGSAAVRAPCWAESSLAADRAPSADHHAHRMAAVSWLPGRCPGSVSAWRPGPQHVPMGWRLHDLWCHSSGHCWFTCCRPVGWVWVSTSQPRAAVCRGRTVSFLRDSP